MTRVGVWRRGAGVLRLLRTPKRATSRRLHSRVLIVIFQRRRRRLPPSPHVYSLQ